MADEWNLVPVIGAQSDADRVIAAIAERQHGIVARWQLIQLGLGRRAIGHRLERGRLHAIQRGLYAPGHRPSSAASEAMAAVLAGGPGAVLSHRAAAWRWDLLSAPASLEVTARHKRRDRPRVEFHRATLACDETTVRHGIPVTTVPRTLLDLAAVVDPRRLERAMNEAEVRRLTDPLSLPDLLERHPRSRGAGNLRAVLNMQTLGAEITRSELEERFLAFLDRAGIDRPRLNAPLQLDGHWIEVDCLWPAERLIVELDGRSFHGTAKAFERDRSRDRALQAAGWRVVRITWRQLHADPGGVARDLRSLLAG